MPVIPTMRTLNKAARGPTAPSPPAKPKVQASSSNSSLAPKSQKPYRTPVPAGGYRARGIVILGHGQWDPGVTGYTRTTHEDNANFHTYNEHGQALGCGVAANLIEGEGLHPNAIHNVKPSGSFIPNLEMTPLTPREHTFFDQMNKNNQIYEVKNARKLHEIFQDLRDQGMIGKDETVDVHWGACQWDPKRGKNVQEPDLVSLTGVIKPNGKVDKF